MLLTSPALDPQALRARTGWELKPEGACKGDICVPLGGIDPTDARALAARLGMPVVEDAVQGLLALGPEAGGRALTTARAPELALPDLNGELFHLSSLRGKKVLVVAWASW